MSKMVSWNDAMDFANAVAFVSGWDDDEDDE